jgi:hypothetical protein
VLLVTGAFLAAVVAVVICVPGSFVPTVDDARNWLIGLQVGLGAAFGYISSDLFGKLEKVPIVTTELRSHGEYKGK